MAGTGDTTRKLPGGGEPLPVPPGWPAPSGAPGLLDPPEGIDSAKATVIAPGRPRSGSGELPPATWQEQAPSEPPGLVPGFEVLRELARGGMGVVFEAWSQRLSCTVALKLIQSELTLDPDAVQRLSREIAAQARLRHPNIVRVLDTGHAGGRPWVAMELVPGESLEQRIKRGGPLPETLAVEWTRALAQALQHAHELGVLHRDLKPANVLVDPQGQPRLIDFGLARLAGDQARLTMTGMILGTPAYMAPEQAGGERERIDQRSDVYGLGAVLYEMLSGSAPYRGSSQLEVLEAVVTRDPEPPSRLRPGLDPRLEAICLRCLARDPDQRFLSMERLDEALAGWQGSGARAPRWALGLAAGSLLLMGLALIALVASQTPARLPSPSEPSPAVRLDPAAPDPVTPSPGPATPAPAGTSRDRLRRALVGPPDWEGLLRLAAAAHELGIGESSPELSRELPDQEARARVLFALHVDRAAAQDLRELPALTAPLQRLLADPHAGATPWGELAGTIRLMHEQRFSQALARLKGLEQGPAGAWALLLQAPASLNELQDPAVREAARLALERARQRDPNLWPTAGVRAYLELSAGDPANALGPLRAAGADRPDAPPTLQVILANVLLTVGEEEESLQLVRAVMRRAPAQVPARLLRTKQLLQAGLAAPALELAQALAREPLTPLQEQEAAVLRVQALFRADRWEDAVQAAGQLPPHPDVLVALIKSLLELGREDEALELLGRVPAHSPLHRLASQLEREVQARWEERRRAAPPPQARPNELLELAEQRQRAGQLRGLLPLLDRLEALVPSDPRIPAERARVRERLGQPGACLRDMQRAATVGGAPGTGERATVARALLGLGRFREARDELARLTAEVDEDQADLALAQAVVGLAELEDVPTEELEQAEQELRRLGRTYPDANWLRARALMELGRHAEALALLRERRAGPHGRLGTREKVERVIRYLERRLGAR